MAISSYVIYGEFRWGEVVAAYHIQVLFFQEPFYNKLPSQGQAIFFPIFYLFLFTKQNNSVYLELKILVLLSREFFLEEIVISENFFVFQYLNALEFQYLYEGLPKKQNNLQTENISVFSFFFNF